MKTIELIEKLDTLSLQLALKESVIFLDKVDDIIKKSKNKPIYINFLKMKKEDIEIDVHLIRMELTKRFWRE